MARVLIGNVKPVKGRDYMNEADMAELDKRYAPNSFGLGGSARHFMIEDIDDFKQSGWFYSTSPYGYFIGDFPIYYILMRVDSWWETAGGNLVVQTIFYNSCEIRRVCDANGWKEWEWVNPLMEVGREYRTTEWFKKKPVYTKLVDCGGCPGTGSKTVTHNAEGVVEWLISATGQVSGGHIIPSKKLDLETNLTNIIIHATDDSMKDALCLVEVKYTKK